MTPISELYKQERERIEIRFSGFSAKRRYGIEQFFRQSYLLICDNEIKRLEGERIEIKDKTLKIMPEKYWRQVGFNFVLDQQIDYWKEQKSIIENYGK